MNNYYKQPKILVWIESILLLFIGLYPFLVVIEKGHIQPLYYLLFILYIPFCQFSITPLFRLIGVYKYYSPMLLGYMANNQQIELHSGTNFDYLFVMRKCKFGVEWRNKILLYHLEGLLSIIQQIENKAISESVTIVGTSYFFNHRTLHKLGFNIEKASIGHKCNLFLNFIDLIWMYSLSQRKFAIPKLWNVHKASIQGSQLIMNKKELENIYNLLKMKRDK